jgi:hypothetical protein
MNFYEKCADGERRRRNMKNLINRFALDYHNLLGFVAGWSAYPILLALGSLLGIVK